MNDFMNRVYWGNTVLLYCITIGSILLAWIIIKLIKKQVISFLKKKTNKTKTSFDDILVRAVEIFVLPYLYLLANYNIVSQLNLSSKAEAVLQIAITIITGFFAIRMINFFIHGGVTVYMERKKEPRERIRQLNGILIVIKLLTWCLGVIMLMDNLGYDVTAIIAGLGVGGIAIALAAQNILGDLFSYLVIFFDKPFEINDFIVVGEDAGIVEKIGLKTTHVRSLAGEQLIMPNSELVKHVIHNYKRLERRRVVFAIGVVYYSKASQLKQIPTIVKEIIDATELATFDRAHLKSFGDFSINYELVYYVESEDYMLYMNIHHNICLALFEKFEKEGIEFAFPTQTIFLNKTNNNNSTITSLSLHEQGQVHS